MFFFKDQSTPHYTYGIIDRDDRDMTVNLKKIKRKLIKY